MKDNTVDKNHKWKNGQWVIEQMFSDYKKLRNEDKHFTKPYIL